MKKLLAITVSILFILMATSFLCYAGKKKENASSPAAPTVVAGDAIHGCYKKENGQLRIVVSTGQCLPSEKPISWNLAGPAGPEGSEGPAGPQGPAGQQGPPGPTGLTGMEATYIYETTQGIEGMPYGTVDVFCESGDAVITGGCDISGSDPQWVLQKTLPLFNILTADDPRNPRDGWSCTYNNVSGLRVLPVQIIAIVLCADLTP
jgi:hypothetical protein